MMRTFYKNMSMMMWGLHNDYMGIRKDNLENAMMVWDVYNDNVGIVSVCGKDEFRLDDIEYDG